MELADIEQLIIDLLAEERGCNPEVMREELRAAGPQLPVDSLLAVEVLARVEERAGVRLSATPENARALTSVMTFAEAIAAELARSSSGNRSA